MKKMQVLLFAVMVCLGFGCSTPERLPSEDLEVFELCAPEIAILHNPQLKPNSQAKYEAAKSILRKVDFTFMRQADTINKIFYHGDALVDKPGQRTRTFNFNYQYGNHYVRFSFYVDGSIVLRAEEFEK